ncbi:hypothetical protein AGMMS50222_04020 [Endomicrobiia bacterium]|nr:hypothetical protein AGMMS50222_04020 [Endomicrobiia bacterium]
MKLTNNKTKGNLFYLFGLVCLVTTKYAGLSFLVCDNGIDFDWGTLPNSEKHGHTWHFGKARKWAINVALCKHFDTGFLFTLSKSTSQEHKRHFMGFGLALFGCRIVCCMLKPPKS